MGLRFEPTSGLLGSDRSMERSGAGGVQIPIELRACDLRVQKWALTSLNSTPHSIQLAHRLSPPLHAGAEHRRCEAYGPESISSHRPLTLSHRMSRMPEERPTPQVPLAIDYLVVPARLELGVGGGLMHAQCMRARVRRMRVRVRRRWDRCGLGDHVAGLLALVCMDAPRPALAAR